MATRFRFYRISGIFMLLAALASSAPADVVTDQAASIIVLPKVVVDSSHDTIIQIGNVSNSIANARCFYVDSNASTEFDITLTKQQPTFWVASQGRLPSNAPPGLNNLVAPVPSLPFLGELLCVETAEDYSPMPGNHLTGQATLTDASTGDIAKYHAIGVQGNTNTNVLDNILCLGGGVTANCPAGPQYDACPQAWFLDHLADGAADSVIGAGSAVHTNLTVVPCTQDLTSQSPHPVDVSFHIFNQFETSFSTGTSIAGPTDISFASIPVFTRSSLGTDYAQTLISPGPGQGTGILTLAQESHSVGTLTASEAINPHAQGQRAGQDIITLPQTTSLPPGTAVFRASGSTRGITSGPDGNLWFTELAFDQATLQEADKIGRVAPSGSPIDEFPVPTADSQPQAITTGPDGNLWFTEGNANQIGRVSPDGSVFKEFAITIGANSITRGPDGNLWFTETAFDPMTGQATNKIGRITPDGATLNEFLLATQDSQLTSITLGPDGNLWFTERGISGGDKIGRITPDGSTVAEFAIPTAGSSPGSITLGPDGNLWFVETNPNAPQIGRITPTGTVSEFDSVFPSTSITEFADGNLWFTGGGQNCVLGRVTPAGVVTAFLNLCGRAITSGPDGRLWLIGGGAVVGGGNNAIIRFSP